jgi:hypothetical protein
MLKSKSGALSGDRRQKARVLTDTPVKVALETEVVAQANPVECKRLFNDSQEMSRKLKQLINNVRRVNSSEEEEEYFFECAKLTQYPEALKLGSSELHVVNRPMTFAPDSETSVFSATAKPWRY